MDQNSRGWVRKAVDGSESAPAGARTAAVPGEPTAGNGTFIDHGVEFNGTLRLSGPFRIDSEFRGEIVSTDKVIVGEAAGIQADIRAREVVICGAVVGNVTASRVLTIRSTGRLHGDVEAPCFEIERGCFFNGRTTMERPEVAARAEDPARRSDAETQATPAPTVAGSR